VESFTVLVHEDWAPIGAARFKELVLAGFYDGGPASLAHPASSPLTIARAVRRDTAQTSASSA
jgi:hypothetical protein